MIFKYKILLLKVSPIRKGARITAETATEYNLKQDPTYN